MGGDPTVTDEVAGPTPDHRRLPRPGRPRSDQANRAILDAARDLIVEEGFAHLRLEHVASRAGVGKATLYRRWPSKEALALDVLLELVAPHLAGEETGSTAGDLVSVVRNVVRSLTETSFGPVIRALLSEIAVNPSLGDPFRASVVEARRAEVARIVASGIAAGDLRPDVDPALATELLVGPVYYRLMFGGELTGELPDRIVAAFLEGHAARAGRRRWRRGRSDGASGPKPGRVSESATEADVS